MIRRVEFAWFWKKNYPVYGPLLDFLTAETRRLRYREEVDFKAFGYDWRKNNRYTAQLLANFMQEKMAHGISRVRILGHSMGNLVARIMLHQYHDLREHTDLLVQIAPPVLGSSCAYYALKKAPEIEPILDLLLKHIWKMRLTRRRACWRRRREKGHEG